LDGQGINGLNGQLDGYIIGDLGSPVHINTNVDQITEELRLTSKPYVPGGFPITWVAGLYYSDQRIHDFDDQYIPGLTNTITNVYGVGVLDALLGGPVPHDEVLLSHQLYTQNQYAVFGDATYHLGPKLRLSVGLRYSYSTQEVNGIGAGLLAGGNSASDVKSNANSTTPRFSASYDIDQNSTVYATASEGFRLGGPNTPIPTSVCSTDLSNIGLKSAPTSYGPDSVWNYEAGIKSRLLNGSLQVTADGYYIKWSNIQQAVLLPTCGYEFDSNVGNATSYGGEIEARYRVLQGLTVGLAGGYTHATIDQANAAIGVQKGADVEGVPDWNATIYGEYTHPITDQVDGFVRVNINGVGPSHGALVNTDPDYNRPSYGLLGASFGVEFGKVRVSVFGTNLTNNRTIIQRPNLQFVNRGYPLQPLTVGLSIADSF
jgi:outer membrane receptor protein involved in Fe transport